jgi:hypothetical protein
MNVVSVAGVWRCYPCDPSMKIRIATTKEAIAVRDAILSGKKLPKKARKK